jgi:hypothetical protein
MQLFSAEALDSRDYRSAEATDGNLARANCRSAYVHCARPTLRDAAAKFCAGKADLVAQDPEQRSFRLDVESVSGSIDGEFDHGEVP